MSSNDWEGIAYNSANNSIYIREPKTKSILRYDEFAKEKLAVIPFDNESYARALETKSKHGLLARIREGFIDLLTSGSETEREAITVNPITNKVYVSDNSLLYEIDG
jgi:hypothetical protein